MRRFDKLVRDRIPEIIAANGDSCETRVLELDEMLGKLRDKLSEEADELITADAAHVVTEAADVVEVVEAIVSQYGLSLEDVLRAKALRKVERGGYESRILLISASERT